MTLGLVLAGSVDCYLAHSLLRVVAQIVQWDQVDARQLCTWACGVQWTALVWVVVAVLSMVLQCAFQGGMDVKSLLNRFRTRRNRRGDYMPIGAEDFPTSINSYQNRSSAFQQSQTSDKPDKTAASAAAKGAKHSKPIRQQRTFNFPLPSGYNYVDIDELPESLQPYSEMVFDLAQALMKQFGFQIDNSRNQAEHLLMMLYNEAKAADRVVTACQ